jgi:hypothetical protein
MNSTVYSMKVEFKGHTWAPEITIHDSGIWRIEGHEEMQSRLTRDQFSDWLMDFWTERNAEKARALK